MEAISILEFVPQLGMSAIILALLVWLQEKSNRRMDRLSDRIKEKDDQMLQILSDYKDTSNKLSVSLDKNTLASDQNTKMTERVYELLTYKLK